MARKSRSRPASSSKARYTEAPDVMASSSSKARYTAAPDVMARKSRSRPASSSKARYIAAPDNKSKANSTPQCFPFSKYRETIKIIYNDVRVQLSQFILRWRENQDFHTHDHQNRRISSDVTKPSFSYDEHYHRKRTKACDISKPSFNYDVHDHQDKIGDKSKSSFSFYCCPLSQISKRHYEKGNKVIMPNSFLDVVISMKNIDPLALKIINPLLHKFSYCGVLEYSGEEDDVVYLPNWMMNSLSLQQGQFVKIECAALSKGTFLKIQPHSTKFIMNLSDPKEAMESILKDFACVTMGDTIMVNHENQSYNLTIVQTRPEKAVSLIETDCELEFTNALDQEEPEKIKPKVEQVEDTTSLEEDATIKPFTCVLDDDDKKLVVSLRKYSMATGNWWLDGNCSLRRHESRGHGSFDDNCSLRRHKSRGQETRQ